jgi:hypothetical protein
MAFVIVPAIAGIIFISLAVGGLWLFRHWGRNAASAATVRPLRRDALFFSFGALLLAGFFLFHAGFFGWAR